MTAPGTTAVGDKQGTNVNAPYTTVKTNNQNGEGHTNVWSQPSALGVTPHVVLVAALCLGGHPTWNVQNICDR